jgi:hypothetical protein
MLADGAERLIVPSTSGGLCVEEYESLKKLVNEIEDDIKKALGGNKAAGTRVRGSMQDVKNYAQEIRKKILELRDDGAKQ